MPRGLFSARLSAREKGACCMEGERAGERERRATPPKKAFSCPRVPLPCGRRGAIVVAAVSPNQDGLAIPCQVGRINQKTEQQNNMGEIKK